jgi:hypothetical protein
VKKKSKNRLISILGFSMCSLGKPLREEASKEGLAGF